MQWRKLGLIYNADGSRPWAKSHAMLPTPVHLSDEVVRVYVTHCDADGVGRPGYVDLSTSDLRVVVGVSKAPLLDLGRPGSFDENGLLACSVVHLGGGRAFMYYVGFELGTKIRYRLLTGLAVSEDGGESFTRYSQTPVVVRSDAEGYFRCGPYCVHERGRFRLW